MKLILIEGLPGSGKSTLAKKLFSNFIIEIDCKYYGEQDSNNPIKMFPFNTYDFSNNRLLFDLIEYIINQWKAFINLIKSDNFLYIMDGRFIHNSILPIYSFLGNEKNYYNVINMISKYILEISPVLIYLDYESINDFQECIRKNRGEEWIKNDINNLTQLPRFIKNKISGKEGWIKFWENWLKIIKKIYQKNNFHKIKIKNNYKNWNENYKIIFNFLTNLKNGA